jgi:hypothetical protein
VTGVASLALRGNTARVLVTVKLLTMGCKRGSLAGNRTGAYHGFLLGPDVTATGATSSQSAVMRISLTSAPSIEKEKRLGPL